MDEHQHRYKVRDRIRKIGEDGRVSDRGTVVGTDADGRRLEVVWDKEPHLTVTYDCDDPAESPIYHVEDNRTPEERTAPGPELRLPGRPDPDLDEDREMARMWWGPNDEEDRPVELIRNPNGTWTARMNATVYTSADQADCWDWLRRREGPGAPPLRA